MVRARHPRKSFRPRGPWLLLALPAIVATGCKSGSWGAKPSWWSFGGTAPASSLTAAPTFEGDVTKPSEAAKPYPTTETPAAYSLTDSTRTDPSADTAGPNSAVLDPTIVTYGSSPPPADPTAPPQAAATAATAQPAAPGVGPQVGPYASLQPTPEAAGTSDAAAAATAGFAAAPAFGQAAPPAQDRYASADPRLTGAGGSSTWAGAAPPAADPDSRYAAATGSRFGGGGQPPFQQPPANPEPLSTPGMGSISETAGPVPSAAGPSIDPAPTAVRPPASPPAAPAAPAAAGDVLPGGIAPPRRRQDPGYRPGGTSSYRPNRAILAGEESAGGVVPASFEAAPSAP
jgi:hypothetical protein